MACKLITNVSCHVDCLLEKIFLFVLEGDYIFIYLLTNPLAIKKVSRGLYDPVNHKNYDPI
jgi:hypothetical protein